MIRIVLPLPPSVNTAFPTVINKRTKTPRRIKSAKYRKWLKQADAHFLTQKRGLVRVTGPYTLRIMVPTAMRGDVSNRVKLIEDFLVSREITHDDKFSQRTSSERHQDVSAGYCWAEIEAVT